MEEGFYAWIHQFMIKRPRLLSIMKWMDMGITAVIAVSYPLFLVWYFINHGIGLHKVVVVPFVGFVSVSLIRYLIGAQRPYEKFRIDPLITKNTIGKSFPSRHAFCAFMIAETYLFATTDAFALPFYVMGMVLSVCRVALGVHFILDVSVGMMVALLCGVLYYI